MKNIICFVAALTITSLSLIAQKHYIGVWRGGNDGYVLLGGITEPKLRQEIINGNTNGLQIVDMESESANIWAGVWRAKKDDFCGVITDVNRIPAMKKEGKFMLSKIELYDGGKFYGIQICPKVMKKWDYVAATTYDAFIKKWTTLSGQGMRLVDVAAYKEGNVIKYAGLFHEGNQAHYLWVLNGWETFTKKWDEMSKANFRLIDLEVIGDQYIGVYQPGSDGHFLWNVDSWDNFVKKWEELAKVGLRLTQFEVTGHN
jgi:hypothetical protein